MEIPSRGSHGSSCLDGLFDNKDSGEVMDADRVVHLVQSLAKIRKSITGARGTKETNIIGRSGRLRSLEFLYRNLNLMKSERTPLPTPATDLIAINPTTVFTRDLHWLPKDPTTRLLNLDVFRHVFFFQFGAAMFFSNACLIISPLWIGSNIPPKLRPT